jgi:polynucleotide 5'-hydroxyl-kinase GRC3/NOL9
MQIDVPQSWEKALAGDLRGILLVIGAPDTGKSTFARYLYGRLCGRGLSTAYLDGDPGQASLGPPATMTLAIGTGDDDDFPPRGPQWRRFVGSVSPRGHMLPMVVGAAGLVRAAREADVEVIVYDTSGLVDPVQGGMALKLAKIDLLQPAAVFAIQRDQELEPLLAPLRHSHRLRLLELRPSAAVEPRDPEKRRAHRAARFADYFRAARPTDLSWEQLAIWPAPDFAYHQLVAFEDAKGYVLGLGIVLHADLAARQVTLLTTLASPFSIDALRLGDISVDPRTYQDRRLGE